MTEQQTNRKQRRTQTRRRPRPSPVYRAIMDPTRRVILEQLMAGPLPAGQIARLFSVSRPAVSRHLRVLRRARLVQERKEGRERVYHLDPTPLQEVDAWLTRFRLFWAARLIELKSFVEDQPLPKGEDREQSEVDRP